MLQLDHIVKVYGTQGGEVHALRDVSLNFRRSEFVSILGPSGCGKTTLLNIIGGLDHYTSGDLVINGRSTREYRDADWDAYRNHSIGFVFQNYNLIPHQTVLSNVELALTLSGVSPAERRTRAEEALRRVGLGDQLHKKPNQMSGGQMQRVAIARALVNDPEILLADEPTGALDSATSVQIMEILKEISRDRLIIMVTHNPELAEQYSTRIIRLLDGQVTGDSDPCTAEELKKEQAEMQARPAAPQAPKGKRGHGKDARTHHTSMSFWTALSLSFNNLMTKKGRSFLTSFAGSIGIIGIALILAVSNGVQLYINSVQQETLTSYPITLQAEQLDMSNLMTAFMQNQSNVEGHEEGYVYSNVVLYQLMSTFVGSQKSENDLASFRQYMLKNDAFSQYTSALQYLYNIDFDVYTKDVAGNTVQVDAGEIFQSLLGDVSSSSTMSTYTSMVSSSSNMQLWEELIPGKEDANGDRAPVSDLLKEQYTLLSGTWPQAYDEVVLIVNSQHELSDLMFYALGLKDRGELQDIMASILAQETYESISESFSYQDLCDISLSLVLPADYYQEITPEGAAKRQWIKLEDTDTVAANGLSLRISGIICPAEGSAASALSGALGYTYLLTDHMIEQTMNSEILRYQLLPENSNYDVRTGLPFSLDSTTEKSDAEKRTAFLSYVEGLPPAQKYTLLVAIQSTMSESDLKSAVDTQMANFLQTGSTLGSPVWDRAKMEEMIRGALSATGTTTSSDLMDKYVAKLSDEKLAALIRSTMETQIAQQYAAAVTQALEAQLDTVTDAERALYKANVLATLSAQASDTLPLLSVKTGYLLQNYQLLTALPQEAYQAYLATRSEAEIDQLLDGLLTIQANTYLAGQVKEESYRANKAALMLDTILTQTAAAPDADAKFAALYDGHMPSQTAKETYDDAIAALGYVDRESPDKIVIYMSTFEEKEHIVAAIDAYNSSVDESAQIKYTDYVALLMSSITTIINAISYVLIAFVAISLVVSSIMIGIITYISVLERTKEIGILRAIGASKRNISGVFNAETLTIGFVSGLIGILVSLCLILVINVILHALTGIPTLSANLPWVGAVALIAISMFFTFIAGLIPSSLAAKKDPVVALRTE